MTRPRSRLPLCAAAAAVVTLGAAPVDPDRSGGTESPETRFEFVLTEGTNVAAALSPDGRTLALDLVGRIWTMPVEGGEAVPLTDPFGDARQPQWSPDGRTIAFQAFWTGDYDVWAVDADGSNLRQITSGPFDDREPIWSPDGRRIFFSSDRGGSYDIWEVDVAAGTVATVTSGSGNEYMPAPAPDGRGMAWVTDDDGGALVVRSGLSAAPARVVELDGADGYAPSWHPDGSEVAYVSIGDGEAALHVVPAAGGEVRRLSADDEDVFPFRSSWSADGRLFYTGDGRVRSVATSGGRSSDIPFSATVRLDRPTYRKRLRTFEPEGSQPVRGIVSPTLSPDGESVLFVALGDLWLMEIGGEPIRLTDDPFVEVDPSWSPDGSRIAYASDRDGGTDVYVRDVASGRDRRLTTDGGQMPVWSPDGREIAYAGGGGQGGAIRIVDVATGTARTVRSGLNSPGRATWSPDGRSIVVSALWRYSTRFREGVNRPLLIPTRAPISEEDVQAGTIPFEGGPGTQRHGGAGADVHGHGPGAAGRAEPAVRPQEGERWLDFAPHGSIASRGTDGPVWSPDGRWIAWVASGVLWVSPVGVDGDPNGPARRLNNERSSDPSWSADGRSLLYLADDRLRRVHVEDGSVEDVEIPLTWTPVYATDRYTVHAGEVFDGASSQLRRNIDIVVDGNRIVRVTDHDARLHDGRVIDASDGVVSPGLIEMHMHGGLGMGEAIGRQWLSFGVTTVRTPAADPFEMVEVRESRASGRRLEPRMFGTGNTIDGSRIYYAGAPALTSNGQIELEISQAEALSFDLIKTYVRLSDPIQRRVVAEAHALGMPVTSHELYPAVAIGADGVEHVKGTSRRGYSTKVSELNRSYQDVVGLLGASGMTITPTVGIYGAYGLVAYDDPSLFDDDRVRAFVPWAPEAARRPGDPDVQRRMVRDMSSLGRRVVEAGGTVVVGTDSPIIPQGLSLIAEMQALVEYGGMSTIDVMRSTTSISAAAMGYGEELGAIREGMLADMIVLGSDPLRDIRAIRDVRMVIQDGRVHTVADLAERPRP